MLSEGLRTFGHALLGLMVNPFYYIGILLVILHYRRQIALERKLFSVRLHSLWGETWRIILWGWIGGIGASIIMMFVGGTMQREAIVLIWVISVLMMVVKLRFLCFAYAIGIIAIVHGVVDLVPQWQEGHSFTWLTDPLLSLHIPSLLALVGVLHLAEAAFIRWQGGRLATPLFFEGKRGKLVGGYQLQGFWPMPLFLVVPATGSEALPWQPLLGGSELWANGWTMLAFPVVMGFSELAVTKLPKLKLAVSSARLAAYGVVVVLLAVCAEFWSPFVFVAAALTIVLHELLIIISRRKEHADAPLFVHDERGLKVLAVLPNSSALRLGIQPGYTITKVNGLQVRTKEQLHLAINENPASCKLEVLDEAGQLKFLHTAIFAGEHHLLGIILAPDERASYYVEFQERSVITYLRSKLAGLRSTRSEQVVRDPGRVEQ